LRLRRRRRRPPSRAPRAADSTEAAARRSVWFGGGRLCICTCQGLEYVCCCTYIRQRWGVKKSLQAATWRDFYRDGARARKRSDGPSHG
jgi:hypothetical protein